MEYQELELGALKNNEGKPLWRRVNYQLVGASIAFIWIWALTVGWMYNTYQLHLLKDQLNSTHLRIMQLEMWQRHMCNLRHYNCPEIDNEAAFNIHPDEYDWNNFPSMDDYHYEDILSGHTERRKREIDADSNLDNVQHTSKLTTKNTQPESASVMPQLEFESPAPIPLNCNESYGLPAVRNDELDEKQVILTSKPIETRQPRRIDDEDYVEDLISQADISRKIERNYQQQPTSRIFTNTRSSRRRPTSSHRITESFEDTQNVVTLIKPSRRYMPAAHFNGDTSKYVLGYHTNFKGNGHMKHSDKTYVDWAPSYWMQTSNVDETFRFQNGQVTIHENGLYFVYAQIYYLDEHDTNGYRVYRNSDSILQCTTMTHSTNRINKGNTCYTAGVEYFAEGDKLSVRDLSDERYSLFEKGKSFFGAIKLSDLKIK